MKKRIVLVLLLSSMFLLTSCGEVMQAEKAISQIGSVSMDSLEKIENAERLYDALPEKQKAKVDNYYMMYSARAEYDRMVIRIQEGINVIASIGEVTKDSADAIVRARQVYDELEEIGLARYVTNDAVLIQAEKQYAGLFLDEADHLLKSQKYQEAYEAYQFVMTNYSGYEISADARNGACAALIGMAENLYRSGKTEDCMKLLETISASYGETEESAALLAKLEDQLERQRPKSGKTFQNSIRWGYNEFTVSASDQDAYVKLENLTDPSKYVMFYVRKGERATVKVQDGVYIVKYTTGKYWFGKDRMFGESASFTKADDTMEFTTTRSGSSVSYTKIEITLYQVVGGNLSTSMIGEEAF